MKLLIISVHPDDETLGCGGSLLAERAAGTEIHWLILTRAHPPQWAPALIERKKEEITEVSRALGITTWRQLDFPAARLDTVPQADLMKEIHRHIDELRPAQIWTVHAGDIHTDHFAGFTALMGVLKPFHMQRLEVKRVLCWETLSSTEAAPPQAHRAFLPQIYRDISKYIDQKMEIMNLYASESQPPLCPRGGEAIRALARWRGAAIGAPYAEAFVLIREII
jgi:LmbE family N-acetylglucosaminyl deacetylase